MASLRPLIAQGRKRLGFLIGAGAPAGITLRAVNVVLHKAKPFVFVTDDISVLPW
jgi:hypothetical protein